MKNLETNITSIKNFIREKYQSLVKKAVHNNIIRKIVEILFESTGIELNEEEKLKE